MKVVFEVENIMNAVMTDFSVVICASRELYYIISG